MAYVSTLLKQPLVISRIITIHYFEYAPSFNFKGEAHNFWEIVYVDAGEVEICADGVCHQLHQGQMIFHKPMEFHTIRSIQGTAPSLVIISFECRSVAMRFFEKRILPVTAPDKEKLSQIIVEASQAFSTPLNVPSVEQLARNPDAPFGAEQLIKLQLETLLIGMQQRSQTAQSSSIKKLPRSITLLAGTKNYAALSQILDYLYRHIGEKRTVEQIAADNLIGRSQLQAIFNTAFGCGVIDLFNELKIDKAKQMIRESKQSLTEIAYALDYTSLPYFSRQFKKITNTSPSAYAKSVKSISERTNSAVPRQRAKGRQ